MARLALSSAFFEEVPTSEASALVVELAICRRSREGCRIDLWLPQCGRARLLITGAVPRGWILAWERLPRLMPLPPLAQANRR